MKHKEMQDYCERHAAELRDQDIEMLLSPITKIRSSLSELQWLGLIRMDSGGMPYRTPLGGVMVEHLQKEQQASQET